MTNIASGTHEHCEELVRMGVVPIFINLLAHLNLDVRRGASVRQLRGGGGA